MFLEALLCVYSAFVNLNGRMHPKELINASDVNMSEIPAVRVQGYNE